MAPRCRFALRTLGGACAGEQWLCDGEAPVARLWRETVVQPEQNLRYFNQVLKPVELRDLRLTPGGPPRFAGAQLYWKMGPVITDQLVAIETHIEGDDRFTLEVITRDLGGVATSVRWVTLSWDAVQGSYQYDVRAFVTLHSPEVFDRPGTEDQEHRFEYCDPWYSDVPAPSVPFAGRWPKRYQRLLAEPADGSVWQMPLNHMATGIPSPRQFAPDGRLVLADEPGANPAIQFVGQTAARTAIGVCNWGYDVHLSAGFHRDELYRPLALHFRFSLCPDADVARLAAAAAPVPPVVYNGHDTLPRYERHSSFATAMPLAWPSDGDTDAWPWLPAGDGAAWVDEGGRSDGFALRICRTRDGASEWRMEREGDGAWTARWTAAIGFRVSVWARTAEVTGRGACLALQWTVYNRPEPYALHCSRRLTGSRDWTRLVVEIHGPPPPDASAVTLVLRQDGAGTTWFDDLDVEVLQGG